MAYTPEQVVRLVDHTLLKPEATDADIRALVDEAKRVGAYSICVSPNKLPLPADIDLGEVKLAVVAGFPSGAHHSEIKAADAGRRRRLFRRIARRRSRKYPAGGAAGHAHPTA